MESLKILIKKALGGKFLAIRRFIRLVKPDARTSLAIKHLKGKGLEIGAMHQPLVVPYYAKVNYVDIFPVNELRVQFPELKSYPMVRIDILDNGEELGKIAPASQDFIIANHLLEHCENPVKVISRFLEVLKKDGVLYLAIPDKRFTFDAERPVTKLEHLIKDYNQGPEQSRKEHFLEWAYFIDKKPKEELEEYARLLMSRPYSIHFHVWTARELSEFFGYLKKDLGLSFDIMESVQSGNENIFILKKI